MPDAASSGSPTSWHRSRTRTLAVPSLAVRRHQIPIVSTALALEKARSARSSRRIDASALVSESSTKRWLKAVEVDATDLMSSRETPSIGAISGAIARMRLKRGACCYVNSDLACGRDLRKRRIVWRDQMIIVKRGKDPDGDVATHLHLRAGREKAHIELGVTPTPYEASRRHSKIGGNALHLGSVEADFVVHDTSNVAAEAPCWKR